MSIERELLKKVISGDNKGDFFISYDLYKEIYEFLVHPEQFEQEPVTDKPTETAMAVMPNGVCVSNVYDAYEEGRKSVMVKQDNIQYLLDQVARLTAENAMLKEKWSAPKREPLSGKEISHGFKADDDATHPYSYWAGVEFAEKHHGIGEG